MKSTRLIHIAVGILLVCLAAPANGEWLFDGVDTAQLQLVETNPGEGSAVLAGPAGINVLARINDDIGAEQMTITEIRKNHIIVEKEKHKLRILLAPGVAGALDSPAGLAMPPGPPSN